MNGQILNNIYDVLSNDPNVQLESKDFESWKSSFLQNEEIVSNVYNYLINKKLTNSSPEQWVKNIQDELDAQQPKQVIEQGGYEYKFEVGEDEKPIYYTKKKGNENWVVVDPKLNEENFITNPAYISIGQEFGHFEDDVFDREAYFKQQKIKQDVKKEKPSKVSTMVSNLGLGFIEFAKGYENLKEGIQLGLFDLAQSLTGKKMSGQEKRAALSAIRGTNVFGNSESYDPIINKLEENIPEYETQSITEDIQKGNYAQAGIRTVNAALRSAPSLVAAATGVGGLALVLLVINLKKSLKLIQKNQLEYF